MVRNQTRLMVGRTTELEALADALQRAREGAGSLVLVQGEAGLGKSRLAAEFLDTIDDAVIATGHGVAMSTGEIPFGTFADTLRDLAPAIDELPDNARDALAPLLPGAANAQGDRVGLVSAALALLEGLATQRLVVWLIEDLHWVDAGTRDLLSLMTRSLPGLKMLVIATIRTEDPDRSEAEAAALTSYVASLVRQRCTEVIRLERLTRVEVEQQLSTLPQFSRDAAVRERIAEMSDGIPFVVEELAAARGRPELTSAAEVAVLRLQSLSAEARRLVEAAAVGDGHLRLDLIASVLDHNEDELDDALREAIATGILAENPGRDGLGFRHALLRDAVDRATTPGARRGWHRRWAEVLAEGAGTLAADPVTVAIAEHWHRAGATERAAVSAVAAAQAAGRMGSGFVEAALWRRALLGWSENPEAMAATGVTRRDALLEAMRVGSGVHRARTQEMAHELRVHFDDDRVAQAYLDLFAIRSRTTKGSWPGGQVTDEQRAAFRDVLLTSEHDALGAETLIGFGAVLPPTSPETLEVAERSIAWAVESKDVRAGLSAHAAWGWLAQFVGDLAGGAARIEPLVARADLAHNYACLGADGNLVYLLGLLGRYAEAEVAIERSQRRVPDPRPIAPYYEHLIENAALVWFNTGQWKIARQQIEALRPYWGDERTCSETRLALIDLAERGGTDTDIWIEDAPDTGWTPVQSLIDHVLALAAAHRGDLAEFRRLCANTWAGNDLALESDSVAPFLVDAARVEADVATSEPDARSTALAALAQIIEVAEKLEKYGAFGVAWSAEVQAQVARARGEADAAALLTESRSLWIELRQPYDAAIVGLALAGVQARAGDREGARALALEVLSVAESLGAGPLARRTDEFLGRLGGASRPSGRLTGREIEVLALLSEGRTNDQIATELFMSPKTASVHVSRIITKLGATNRTEAAAIARREALLG